MAVAAQTTQPIVARLIHGQKHFSVRNAVRLADRLRVGRLAMAQAVLQNQIWRAGLNLRVSLSEESSAD